MLARQRVRQVAAELGLAGGAQNRLVTAVSEIARNAFQYGESGRVEILLETHGDDGTPTTPTLWVRIHDRGPGISDLQNILGGTDRSKSGLGLGLRGAKRLVERFSVTSEPGSTRVDLGQTIPGRLHASQIRELIEELARAPEGDAFTEILQQNQELLSMQQALAQANQDLEDADHAKDRFLAMLGHELRNLLNALRSSLDVLRRSSDPRIRERMESLAVGQTDHLRRLVDDLLDASQIQRGQLDIRAVPLDLPVEVDGLLESWREEVARAGLRLRVDRPDRALWIRADPTRLTQILGNLFSNACKFTDAGGEIRLKMESIHVRGLGRRARVTVADTGCGLKEHELKTIFEPFTQAAEARQRMTGGLGLGLAIVAGLVESQGGRIWAESDGPGEGSLFIVELPAIDAPQEPVTLTHAAGPQPLRILLVDDHRASAESLGELLRLEGHAVEVAFDAAQALERYRSQAPDVVLCDIGLPGMDGYEVARTLRRSGDELRLLALSGFADPASKSKALESGFDAHLSKPVDVRALLDRLKNEPDER
ncbi:MAG: ATP-binding protein [Acidobacteriota bacterium]